MEGQLGHVGWGWTPSRALPALSQLRTIQFRRAAFRGYHRGEVDGYLLLAAGEVDAILPALVNDRPIDHPTQGFPVLWASRTVEFKQACKGYDRDDVDRYLDCVAQEVDALVGSAPAAEHPPPFWPAPVPATGAQDDATPHHPVRTTLLVLWALLPLVSLGLLAVPCILYAAIRLRSRRLAAFTVGYLAVTVLGVWLGNYPFDSWQSSASATILFCTGFVVMVHCFELFRPMVSPESGRQPGWRRFLS